MAQLGCVPDPLQMGSAAPCGYCLCAAAAATIEMGNPSVAAESSTIRIGNHGTQTAPYVAGISGVGVVGERRSK